jgi:hypothetical protein
MTLRSAGRETLAMMGPRKVAVGAPHEMGKRALPAGLGWEVRRICSVRLGPVIVWFEKATVLQRAIVQRIIRQRIHFVSANDVSANNLYWDHTIYSSIGVRAMTRRCRGLSELPRPPWAKGLSRWLSPKEACIRPFLRMADAQGLVNPRWPAPPWRRRRPGWHRSALAARRSRCRSSDRYPSLPSQPPLAAPNPSWRC